MKKNQKVVIGTMLTAVMLACSAFSAFAGQWKLESLRGWQYEQDDGTIFKNGWQQIEGIYYYFDENGYMLAGEQTPDGYFVGANGAWMEDQKGAELTDGVHKGIVSYMMQHYSALDGTPAHNEERSHPAEYDFITISEGTGAGTGADSHKLEFEGGSGYITNIGNGTYRVEPKEVITALWAKKVTCTTDYIFVKCYDESMLDSGWAFTTVYQR